MSMSPYLGIYEGSIILEKKGKFLFQLHLFRGPVTLGEKKGGKMKSTKKKKNCKKQRESGSTLNILIKSSKHKNVT